MRLTKHTVDEDRCLKVWGGVTLGDAMGCYMGIKSTADESQMVLSA